MYASRKHRSGDDGANSLEGETAIDGKPETLIFYLRGMRLCLLMQVCAQRLDAIACYHADREDGGRHQCWRGGEKRSDFLLDFGNSNWVDAIDLGQRHDTMVD